MTLDKYSELIKAMKELSGWRFFAVWLVLILLAATPFIKVIAPDGIFPPPSKPAEIVTR